jgi:dienelactone hydrolase
MIINKIKIYMKKSISKTPSLCWLFLLFYSCSPSQTKNTNMQKQEKTIPETITFNSLDNLPITANLYFVNEQFPFIVLCHQAGYNKSEYAETALKLNDNGFNCLAIDQRSGGQVDGTFNETNRLALQKNKLTTYLDAEQDIVAAVNYIAKKYNTKIILFGSSYSGSLALKIAKENVNVKAVIAFSPGEYFGDKLNLTLTIKDLNKPMFVSSSKDEAPEVSNLIKNVSSDIKVQFIPKGNGVHGASALMEKTPNNKEYWEALLAFLNKIKNL